MIAWSSGEDACVTCRRSMVRFHPRSLINKVCKCSGSTRLWYGRRPGSIPGRTSEMGWHVPRGRQILARSVRRVRFPCGPLNFRKVAGYGLPGRFAKPCDFLSHVGSNPMPSAFAKRLDGETDIMSRFEREVPGSNPGRATVDIRKRNPSGDGNRFEPG